MRWTVIVLALVFMATGSMAGAVETTSHGLGFPEQCTGKEVTCENTGIGSCTAMYCPGTTTYNDKGQVVSMTDDCNQCTYTRRCWCGDYSFTITK